MKIFSVLFVPVYATFFMFITHGAERSVVELPGMHHRVNMCVYVCAGKRSVYFIIANVGFRNSKCAGALDSTNHSGKNERLHPLHSTSI